MSRFLTNTDIDPDKFLIQVRYYPYYVFATDFIYFTLQNCGIDWIPYEIDQIVGVVKKIQQRSTVYSPHKLSPCTTAVQTAVAKILDRNTRNYAKIYDKIVADSIDKLGTFLDHVTKVLAKLATGGGTPVEMLFKLLYVGQLTAVFYEQGTPSAADLAPSIITTALREINIDSPPAQWFKRIELFSREVVYWYENDSEFTLDVYLSEVGSDKEPNDDAENADGGEEEDCRISDTISDKRDRNVDEREGKDNGVSDKTSDKLDRNIDEGEDCGASCEISDKRDDHGRREREENPDGNLEATGEKLSKKDWERGEKLKDSSRFEDSCIKTDDSSSDKDCSRLSDDSDRAYDASCSSNNELDL